ncbi:MAG TPA: hypothetical protein VJ546_04705 [Bacillales bacterium]|nr:hypothetical protein [Bacillales bacterium]
MIELQNFNADKLREAGVIKQIVIILWGRFPFDKSFYFCEMINQLGKPLEEDHSLIWLELEKAIESLFHEHQSWAVKKAMQLFRRQRES